MVKISKEGMRASEFMGLQGVGDNKVRYISTIGITNQKIFENDIGSEGFAVFCSMARNAILKYLEEKKAQEKTQVPDYDGNIETLLRDLKENKTSAFKNIPYVLTYQCMLIAEGVNLGLGYQQASDVLWKLPEAVSNMYYNERIPDNLIIPQVHNETIRGIDRVLSRLADYSQTGADIMPYFINILAPLSKTVGYERAACVIDELFGRYKTWVSRSGNKKPKTPVEIKIRECWLFIELLGGGMFQMTRDKEKAYSRIKNAIMQYGESAGKMHQDIWQKAIGHYLLTGEKRT